ncbi:hypothetical protein ACGFI9_35920 [Micromonospora sp. NPDC048930]|uniref:hypothetical protein n=1 Tax=Micromonospora sp. NPDC048930 TaxID=3364261 RepID=UPI0037243413
MTSQHETDIPPISALPLLTAQLEASKLAIQAHLSLLPATDLPIADLRALEQEWEASLHELHEMFELPGRAWLEDPDLSSSSRREVDQYLALVGEVRKIADEIVSAVRALGAKKAV